MRTTFIGFLFVLVMLISVSTQAREISLYDSAGDAVAYIDTDDDLNIYLWGGKPVAYLDGDSLYGFNGNHLGWFKEGIVMDHQGYAVGFVEGAVNKLTNLERLKSLQQLCPLKSLQQLEPLEPLQRNHFSRVPLDIFLAQGR